MKIVKINNKDYVIKFTSECIKELHSKGITIQTLIDDIQVIKVDNLYDTFYYSLKAMQHDITLNKALNIIDEFYQEDEDNDIQKFFNLVVEEYSVAMGLGKKFRELMKEQEQKTE